VQPAAVHDTPFSVSLWPAFAGGCVLQLVPFHTSASARCGLAVSLGTETPTAVHDPADAHETACSSSSRLDELGAPYQNIARQPSTGARSMSSIDPTAVSAYWPGAGIGSASAARPGGALKGSAKYWVSCVTRPSVISMTLSEYVGTPS
jgi:hypothetical protein